MAKISARGDREERRWRRPSDGAELVLTVKGRVLWKPFKGAGFTAVAAPRPQAGACARRLAEQRGLEATR